MQIHPKDNVEVGKDGHKYALVAIEKGSPVIKYGFPIGVATADIGAGELVHSRNLKTALSAGNSYTYAPRDYGLSVMPSELTFDGYLREDGSVGIRNEIWIVNTVGCVNKTAEELARRTGARCFPHPYGCSQLGDDKSITQKILAGLIRHPNAGGVLVLGLGCENSNIAELKKELGEYNPRRVRFLNCQDVGDELAEGERILAELRTYADGFARTPIPVSRLCIGLKCGGSDGYSGITANPLVGCVTNRLVSCGGSALLTEVPEMFGAEHLLMERCTDEAVFMRTVRLIETFKEYFISHGQPVGENPSPGNKEGGITTLEEKSLGCVQKGGIAPVVDVLDYGERVRLPGLSLLNGPGNDAVAVTNLTAAGAHLILFTTGRGTPLGAPVPTLKISTNAALAEKKPHWIDFDASPIAEGQAADALAEELFSLVLSVASGKEAKNEEHGYREIAIFKDGVTL